MFTRPEPYIGAVVLVLTITLYITTRTDGWLPSFRMLRVRRALVLTLLVWGISVLIAPLHATSPKPTPPVVIGWDQPVVPASFMRKNTGSREHEWCVAPRPGHRLPLTR